MPPKNADSNLDSEAFLWDDPLLLEDQLDEEEVALCRAMRAFGAESLLPRIVEAARNERFDREIVAELGARGYLGSTIDGCGCAPGNYVAYGLIARELERIDSSYRTVLSVQSSLVMHPIHRFGTDEQKAKYLPKLAKGEWIGCFGLTEPNSGSDPASLNTRARPAPGGLILSATMSWISHPPAADVLIVWAKTDDDIIRGFILERGMAGLSTPKIEGKLSMRACTTGLIVMDEVFGADNYLGTIVWQRRFDPRNTARHISADHDYLIVFAKDARICEFNQMPRTEAMIASYSNPDDDPRGPWRRGDLAARNPYSLGRYPITTPSGRVIEGPPSGS